MQTAETKKELSKLAKSKKDRISNQITIEDKANQTSYFAEFVIDKNYTRYTVTRKDKGDIINTVSNNNDNFPTVFSIGTTELDGDDGITLKTNEETADIADIWDSIDDDVFGSYDINSESGAADDNDPNSELYINDNNDDVDVLNDAVIDNKDIIVKHFGTYNEDHFIEVEKGYLMYDEFTTGIDNLTLSKLKAGNDGYLDQVDEAIMPLTTFHASKGVRRTNSDNDLNMMGNVITRTAEYVNRDGDVLIEVYDIHQNLLQQHFISQPSRLDMEITINYKIKKSLYGSPRGDFYFGTRKFPIDYTESTLELKAMNTKAGKEKQAFRIRKNRRCLHLPNIHYFSDRLNMDYVKTANYEVVDDLYRLREIHDYLLSIKMKGNVNAYDAETKGLRFHRWLPPETKHTLVTHSLSWEDNQSIIVPVRMKYCKNIRPEEAAEMIRPILETTDILAHNGCADVRFNIEEGIDINLKEDTMQLIKHLIPFINHIEVMGFGKALDDLIFRAFGVDLIDLNKHVFKPSGVSFDYSLLNRDYMIYYGCPDTDWCRRLWKGLRPKLAPSQELAYRYSVEFSKQMAINGTYGGMGVDEKHIKIERDNAQSIVDILEEVIYTLTGESRKTLSLTSSVQKTMYVFGKMGADKKDARKTAEGNLSADKTVIEKLGKMRADTPHSIFTADVVDEAGDIVLTAEELNISKFPFCKLIRKHGDLTKNITAFYNGILNNSVNGVYYPDYRIGATDTWRTTDRIQITKKTIKTKLGDLQNEAAGFDKWSWFSTDYAAEEFRLAANGSEDWALIDMLIDHEADPHTMVASELNKIPPSKVTSELRGQTKAANFGIIYGMKPRALAVSITRKDDPSDEEVAVASDLYNLYCYKRALMLQPLEKAKDFVRENGWLENQLGFRMVYYQIINVKEYVAQVFKFDDEHYNEVPNVVIDPDLKRRFLGALLNACGNFPIQSWAGGTLMEVFGSLNRALSKEGIKDKIIIPLSVHDEVGGSYEKDEVHAYNIIRIQNETMVSKLPYLNKKKVAPLYIGIGFGKSWGEAKSDDLEIPVHLQHLLIEEYNNGTAPTIEEIREEGVKEHFVRRIHEYMRERVRGLFSDMIEKKHFNRQQMQYRLNLSMFVGKKINELFKTNDKVTMEIILEKYMEVIFYPKKLDEIISDGYTWEEGDLILEEWEKEAEPEEIQDFFFLPQIHPMLVIENRSVTVDMRGIYHPIVINAVKYLRCLCEPENIHSKQIIVLADNGSILLEEKITGMPANFSYVFNKILGGATLDITQTDISKRAPGIILKEHPVVYQGENGKYKVVVNAILCNQIHPDLFNGIATILNEFVSSTVISQIPIIIRGDNEVDTGLRMISINVKMQESINKIVDHFLSVSNEKLTEQLTNESAVINTESNTGNWQPVDSATF